MEAKQLVPCKREGCRGSCPRFVVLAGKKKGDPAVCRVCGNAFKLPPGTYADAAKAGAKAGGKGGGADKALLARLEALQRENAQLKAKPERSAGAVQPPSEPDELAQALALQEALRKAQAQGADVAVALQTQADRVQKLRDARLASKPAHAQLRQLDEQIGKKNKQIERLDASVEEFLEKVRAAREQAEEARGELEKLKAQKQALSLAPTAGAATPDGDPLGQMSSFTAAVKKQLEGFVSPCSPRVTELQTCFSTLEECLSRLRAEVVASAPPAAGDTPASAPRVPEDSAGLEADELEPEEDIEEDLLRLGVKREQHAELRSLFQAKRQKRESRG
jgi:DNA repair exonuclease SbcCD ATPase subunit